MSANTERRGGTLGYLVPANHELVVHLDLPCSQEIDLYNNGILDAEVLEYGLDKLTLLCAQLAERVSRAVVVDIADTRNPADIRDKLIAAADASAKACACADTACECAATAVDAAETATQKNSELKNLSIAVDDAPYGHMMSAGYNAKTGMLTFRIPEGKAGKDGQNGKNGTDGTDGVQGPAGPKGPQGEQGEMGGSPLPMAFGQFRVTADGMLALSYSGSIEPEKIAINPTTGELEVYYANN